MMMSVFYFLVVLAVAAAIVVAVMNRVSGIDRGVDPAGSSPSVRNHREMARLIERLVRDDDVRPLLPADELDVARMLLREYWGDSPKQLP